MKNACAGSVDALTFAHLSDPHLSTLQQVKWRDLMNKRLLGYLSWRRKRRFQHRGEVLQALRKDLMETAPGHIIITGDLTHIALPEEFLQARRWLESVGSSRDVTVVPGNHDAYAHVAWQQGFAQWLPYMRSDDDDVNEQAAACGTGPLFPSLRVRGPVAFIGLSSARVSAPFMATGYLGDKQLRNLSELLEKTVKQGLFRIVLLHHPPLPGEEKWRKRLTDAHAVCEILAAYGAELVLHGHSHRCRQSRIERKSSRSVPVFGISSASSVSPDSDRAAAYRIYRVEKFGNEWKLDISMRAYSSDNGRFTGAQKQSMCFSAGAL